MRLLSSAVLKPSRNESTEIGHDGLKVASFICIPILLAHPSILPNMWLLYSWDFFWRRSFFQSRVGLECVFTSLRIFTPFDPFSPLSTPQSSECPLDPRFVRGEDLEWWWEECLSSYYFSSSLDVFDDTRDRSFNGDGGVTFFLACISRLKSCLNFDSLGTAF